MRQRQYHCENNELAELSVLRYKEKQVYPFVETLMPHAILDHTKAFSGPEMKGRTTDKFAFVVP